MSWLTPKHLEDASRVVRGLALVMAKMAADRCVHLRRGLARFFADGRRQAAGGSARTPLAWWLGVPSAPACSTILMMMISPPLRSNVARRSAARDYQKALQHAADVLQQHADSAAASEEAHTHAQAQAQGHAGPAAATATATADAGAPQPCITSPPWTPMWVGVTALPPTLRRTPRGLPQRPGRCRRSSGGRRHPHRLRSRSQQQRRLRMGP